jgi:ribosomal protein S17E
LVNAFSGYFIGSNYFEAIRKIFDKYGYKVFTVKNAKSLDNLLSVYTILDNPPSSFKMLLDLCAINYNYSVSDDVLKMLKKYGKEETLKYLDHGYMTVTSVEFYKKFYDYSFLWWNDEIGGHPILKSLINVDVNKIEKISVPPMMYDSTLRAFVPVFGAVKSVKLINEYMDMPDHVAKYIYVKSVENPEIEYTTYTYLKEMTHGKISKHFIRVPRTWENWILIEWLINKINTAEETMTKDRIVHGPAGQTKTFQYIDILDEVRPEDLVNGIKTKPDKVFERSAKRIELEMKEKMGENVDLPKSPWKNNKEVVQIKDSKSLKEEGKKMNNCVAGYLSACLKEKTYIFHVNKEDGCTMEVAPDGTIYQIYRPGNVPASQEQLAAVKRWTKENSKTKFTFKMSA